MMTRRYYYKKDGKPAYNLKEPLENILDDVTGYVEITKEEWDELTYVPPIQPIVPTDEELAAKAEAERKAPILAEIAECKRFLNETDYIIIKIAECVDADNAALIRAEYADVIAERQVKRARINELENA